MVAALISDDDAKLLAYVPEDGRETAMRDLKRLRTHLAEVEARAAMREAMKAHLDQTLVEAQHELTGHYRASVKDYRAVHRHILMMADTLSDGIIQAFPKRFR